MGIEHLKHLVSSRANEREIQAFMKENLHILGSVYAPAGISDEYIVFSEFEIFDGKSDFIVFTNRSRMDVIIIEIKGADFNFLNLDNTISNKISQAEYQVFKHFDRIESNYDFCRRYFHEVRRDVECGKTRFNSLLGSSKSLHVDPLKHIRLKGVVIGGQSTNDSEESKVKNLREKNTSRITYDTWESWLKNNGFLDQN